MASSILTRHNPRAAVLFPASKWNRACHAASGKGRLTAVHARTIDDVEKSESIDEHPVSLAQAAKVP
jgi:hypothetical protein